MTSEAVLWSALSLIALLTATGLVLLACGKFDYLGWKNQSSHVHPQLIPGVTSDSQRATIKYFLLAAVLFLAQSLVGGATANYRADPGRQVRPLPVPGDLRWIAIASLRRDRRDDGVGSAVRVRARPEHRIAGDDHAPRRRRDWRAGSQHELNAARRSTR